MSLFALLSLAISTPAQPVGDPQSWIIPEDYPDAALATGAEGPIRAILSIDASGAVVDCKVNLSSGNADLDAATCAALRRRARFSPARDDAGVAIASTKVQSIRWAMPRERLISQGFRMTYTLDSRGRITGCKIDEFGGHDPDLTCSPQNVEEMARAYLSKSLEHYASISILMAMEIDDSSEINVLRSSTGERKIIVGARARVSSSGVIAECRLTQVAEMNGATMDLCAGPIQVGQKEFEPDPAGKERFFLVRLELNGEPR